MFVDYGETKVVMLCPGSEEVNDPPETAIAESVARSWLLDVRYGVTEAGAVPLEYANVWLTVEVPVLTATITDFEPDLKATT